MPIDVHCEDCKADLRKIRSLLRLAEDPAAPAGEKAAARAAADRLSDQLKTAHTERNRQT